MLGDYYAAASYCFGATILLRRELYAEQRTTPFEIANSFSSLSREVESLGEKVSEEKIETIADLETLMIVRERLEDVKTQIKTWNESKRKAALDEQYGTLAYAEERLFSAAAWMSFFEMGGKRFVLEKEVLRTSCLQKISESEERHQYTSLFLGEEVIAHIREKITTAEEALEQGNYELCLITASQAKADANAILSSLGLSDDVFMEFFQAKKKAAERVIAENSAEDIFPILGYSYYQYANSLQNQEKYTALLYLEYALELSELSIYFPEEKEVPSLLDKAREVNLSAPWKSVIMGFLAGAILTAIISYTLFKRKHQRIRA